VHARNAWLKGLSPKENREVPPLRYDFVHRLKRDFPTLTIVINGGFADIASVEAQTLAVDGVMLGRAAYHDSWLLAQADVRLFGGAARSRADVIQAMIAYARAQAAHGVALRQVARHILGLYHGLPRARLWRRLLSDPALLAANDPALLAEALERVEGRLADAA
jgi:tRNA-dihydrouridine synthase A